MWIHRRNSKHFLLRYLLIACDKKRFCCQYNFPRTSIKTCNHNYSGLCSNSHRTHPLQRTTTSCSRCVYSTFIQIAVKHNLKWILGQIGSVRFCRMFNLNSFIYPSEISCRYVIVYYKYFLHSFLECRYYTASLIYP